ncbi:alpha-ketoglutarate-dependent dioxygenase AlkB [Phenylobacterium sp.]|jgi:alkylated DNA repair dioxygenase AlkB|uniref:alpha-ketoglutarate-dependent dioxygenase AlkB n=1 Tax=Phenylobacterium sp. TaxID=1871053 RepID=UPI0037848C73
MTHAQPSLFEPDAGLPPGFVYRREFLSADEEAAIAAQLAALPFAPFLFRGVEARRRVYSFGWRYDFTAGRVEEAEPIPPWLEAVRARAEALAGLAEGALQQLLINEYLPGAPIGWHRDRAQFDRVVGVSLLAPCLFRLRKREGTRFARAGLTLAPRSAYVIAGEARQLWEHSIPPVSAHRYSLTFRSFR